MTKLTSSQRFSLLPLFGFFSSIGVDLRKTKNIIHFARYFRDLAKWVRSGGKVSLLWPIVGEWDCASGVSKGHYFYQDILVANFIFRDNPKIHVDVGSRLDGFVAHVASFRDILVFDIRPASTSIRSIKFEERDIMDSGNLPTNICDSLSCLHAIEHFGLGRYGDEIDPEGHKRGFYNLVSLLRVNGMMYISFPIGKERIEFNAQRILAPTEILSWPGARCLELCRFDVVDDNGDLHEECSVDVAEGWHMVYGCGIYSFRKIKELGDSV